MIQSALATALMITTIIGADDREPATAVRDGGWPGRFAAVLRMDLGDARDYCTAFVIADQLVMTNDHCADSCANIRFEEGYDDAATGPARRYRCVSRVAHDYWLDFAIYAVTTEDGAPTPAPLTFTTTVAMPGTPLLIAGHPAGEPKQIDRSADCRAIVGPNPSPRTLYHTCDTLSGNSGSPLFARDSGFVAGLHHRSGGDWNAGLQISAILDWLAQNAPDVRSRLSVRP